MTKVEAVNKLVRLIGGATTSSILNNTDPDVVDAEAVIDEWVARTQRRGWWFNQLENVLLEPDAAGRIMFDNTISTVEMADRYLERVNDQLQDTANQTNIFTHAVCANKIILTKQYDDLPLVVQDFVASRAAADFVREQLEDVNKEQSLKEEASVSWVEMQRQDLRVRKPSMWDKARLRSFKANYRPRSGTNPYTLSGG